jgi:hypothetical protein
MFLRTDASTSIGAGGYLTHIAGGQPLDLPDGGIRWTRAEFAAFKALGVSINVLEYFAVVFYVLLWARELRGAVVKVECDNTSAVSWLLKSRATRGTPVADVLVKLFTLFTYRMSIVVLPSHLRGVDNVVADFRSRDLTYAHQEQDEGIVDISGDGEWSRRCSRRELCRSLLFNCVTHPERMHGQVVAEVLTTLVSGPGMSTARS